MFPQLQPPKTSSFSLGNDQPIVCSVTGPVENANYISSKGVSFPNECLGYEAKQSEGEASVMLELLGMWHTPSMPSPPRPFWARVVAPDRVLSMAQRELCDMELCKQMTDF